MDVERVVERPADVQSVVAQPADVAVEWEDGIEYCFLEKFQKTEAAQLGVSAFDVRREDEHVSRHNMQNIYCTIGKPTAIKGQTH